ncbi:uncharacterized protein [Salmo salar]|uniref:Uncharacterized protein n=1 Tax=Salmo salar TaxID=8030 RepID=A0A1S3MR86_SALSA|nr:uncharacterized protein LOC106574172 [Salmo salar]|eukprot:XP_014005316.1 PREDICTED: uncharacterized protein LOC106574172 [Salmo salar]
MFYYSRSKPLLLVVLIVLFNGHNWADKVVGIIGHEITIPFSFHNMSKASGNVQIGLYKNSKKISECNNDVHSCCSQSHLCFSGKKVASFFIRNLTSVDNGTYWITLFQTSRDPPMLQSNEVTLILQSDGNTTESPSCTSNAEDDDISDSGKANNVYVLIIFAVLGVSIIALLIGLLGWFCWTYNRSPEGDQQENLKAKQQGSREASTSMSVYSVEYGVLDFNRRPSGEEGNRHGREREGGVVRSAETVEYAAITFPPQQRVSYGR